MTLVITKNKVKELRARYDVTQIELAAFLGIAVMNLRRKEKGMTLWKEDEMHLVVYFFNNYFGEQLTLQDLFMGDIIEVAEE